MRKSLSKLLSICVFLSIPALANTFTFTLNIDGCSGGCGTNPFGTVTVSDTGVTGQVSLDVNVLPNFLLHTGNGSSASTVGFNLDPNVTNLAIVNSTLPNWSVDSASNSSINGATFGTFEYSLNCCNDQNGASHEQTGHVTLTLSATSLTASSFLQKSVGGSPNAYFVVDIQDDQSPGNTGLVGANTFSSSVPDGGVTVMLLGGALLGIESLRRKLRS